MKSISKEKGLIEVHRSERGGAVQMQSISKLLDAVFQVANVGICVTDEDGCFVLINDAYCRIYGYSRDELLGNTFTLVVQDALKEATFKTHEDFLNGCPEISKEWQVVTKDGKILDVLVTAGLLTDEDGKKYKVTTVEDITLINVTRSRLNLISEAIYKSSEGMIFAESNYSTVIHVNEAYYKITGYDLEDLMNQRGNILEKGLNNQQFYENLWKKVEQNGSWKGEVIGKRKNKEKYIAILMIVALKDDEQRVKNYVGIINEITEQKDNKKRMEYLSTHSIVTDLPNRYVFEERLRKEVENNLDSRKCFAMFYINIDGFKYINDTYGFQFGDKLLKVFADRLKAFFRKDVMLGYFGVDKFGVIVNDARSEEHAATTAELLIKRMAKSIIIDNNKIQIYCSIGISLFPQESKTAGDLLKHSEEAMIKAKKEGGKGSQFYTQEMHNKLLRQRKIEEDLKRNIDNTAMFLVYQPQVDITTSTITGVEALMRWHHPVFGMISPAEFIPIAEEIGEIHKIGEWTLREACKQSKIWSNQGINVVIAVNMSSHQLKQDNIVEKIIEIVEEFGISPHSLELEITEGCIIEDINKSIDKILQSKQYGIKVDIDDFGTGYSSLNYIRKLPLYKVKIDKSFIVDFSKDFDSMVVTKTIIDMAHNLRFKVIAEGVETLEQLQFLRENGCDEIQGYYYSKPLLPEVFENFWLGRLKLNRMISDR